MPIIITGFFFELVLGQSVLIFIPYFFFWLVLGQSVPIFVARLFLGDHLFRGSNRFVGQDDQQWGRLRPTRVKRVERLLIRRIPQVVVTIAGHRGRLPVG